MGVLLSHQTEHVKKVGTVVWGVQDDIVHVLLSDTSEMVMTHISNYNCSPDKLTEHTSVVLEIDVHGRKIRKANLLSEETNPAIISYCFRSSDRRLWIPVFGKYITSFEKERVVEVIVSKFPLLLTDKERDDFINSLPDRILEELVSFLMSRSDSNIWQLLPNHILIRTNLEAFAPMDKRIQILLWKIKNMQGLAMDEITNDLIALFEEMTGDERLKAYPSLPEEFGQREEIIELLPIERMPSTEQISYTWNAVNNGSFIVWQKLSLEAKVLTAYKVAKEARWKSKITSFSESSPLAQVVILLLWAQDKPNRRKEAFKRFHEILEEYVCAQAWLSSVPMTLEPLLPICRPKIMRYCEGRAWFSSEDRALELSRASRAFCPRKHKPCGLLNSSNHEYNLSGAHIYADCSQDWVNWTLLELLEITNVTPVLDELRNPEDYVNKLAGWINRLNDIRQRLKCSKCGRIMRSDKRYAKFLATFNATVFSCLQGQSHDIVYINVCWGCENIIDSRESRIKVEGFYLCLHCGSGPKTSKEYRYGNICPSCGTQDMLLNDTHSQIYTYTSCRHSIYVPKQMTA